MFKLGLKSKLLIQRGQVVKVISTQELGFGLKLS